jgi:LAO/AO transport system kinase
MPPGPIGGRGGRTITAALADRVRAARSGSVRAIARLLTMVENGGEPAAAVAESLSGAPREAQIVGVTGAPGAGKSTLTAALLHVLREAGERVAVLAVDPSSPFTGGALLGDRVRMADFATDASVFIRSLSSRGHLGGLSAGTPAAVDLMSALGFGTVIVETVGVGQSETDVMHLADTVAVVLAPGMGDAVQAAKAGIMEIADVLVVNKADHEGARSTARELRAMLMLDGRGDGGWQVPVLSTIADRGDGVAELAATLRRHREHLTASGELRQRRLRRAAAAVQSIVVDGLRREMAGPDGRAELARAADSVIRGSNDPYAEARTVTRWLHARR